MRCFFLGFGFRKMRVFGVYTGSISENVHMTGTFLRFSHEQTLPSDLLWLRVPFTAGSANTG